MIDARNHEHYADPTAGAAMTSIQHVSAADQQRVSLIVKAIRALLDAVGLELGERIVLVDRRTGRWYR